MSDWHRDDAEQGTDEWYEARAGVITASAFDAVMAVGDDKYNVVRPTGSVARSCKTQAEAEKVMKELASKSKLDGDWKVIAVPGEPGKTHNDLRYKLATERLLGRSLEDEGFSSYWMERGKEIEDMGRAEYELMTGHTVEVPGLIYLNSKKRIGASLDGIIDSPKLGAGNFEMKCPKLKTHVKYMLENRVPPEYFWQVQGQLMVTGLPWAHFVSYHPESHQPLWIVHVKPDDKAIKKLRSAVNDFVRKIDSTVKALKKLSPNWEADV